MSEEIRAQINGFLGCPVVKKIQVRLVQNLERIEAGGFQDEFARVKITKPVAFVAIAKAGPHPARIVTDPKAKVPGYGEERLD